MATDAERALLASQILPAVGREAARLPNSEVTGFLAMAGARYNCALMVVGRAVNGWTTGILPHGLASREACESYAGLVQKSVAGNGKCPMRWVSECWGDSRGHYNTKRSAFWRAIHGVVVRLSIANLEDAAWPSCLVWSNLYKVSPSESGNPGGALCEAQLPGCIELLRLEVKTYKPSRLLFLTGRGWLTPFLDVVGGVPQERAGFRYVEGLGTIMLNGGRPLQYVVAVHPQGKPEEQWIDEVVKAYTH